MAAAGSMSFSNMSLILSDFDVFWLEINVCYTSNEILILLTISGLSHFAETQ